MQLLEDRRPALHSKIRILERLRLASEQGAVERAVERGIAEDLVRSGIRIDTAAAVAQRARSAAVRACRELEEDDAMYVEGHGIDTWNALKRSAAGRDTLARLSGLGVSRDDVIAWHDRSRVERRARIVAHSILLLDAFRAATARGLPPNHAARVARRHHPRYARSVRTIFDADPDPLLPRELEPRVTRHLSGRMAAGRDNVRAELRTYRSFNAWAWERIQIGWL